MCTPVFFSSGGGGGVGASVFEAEAPIKFSYLPVYIDLANRA